MDVLLQQINTCLHKSSDHNEIHLDNTWIRFVEDEDGRGSGVSAFCIEVNDKEYLEKKANDLGLIHKEDIVIGGVKFLLS